MIIEDEWSTPTMHRASHLSTTPGALRSQRPLLRSIFIAMAVVLLLVSGLGVWGVAYLHQQVTNIVQVNVPHSQALADAQSTFLTLQRDDRQALIETNLALRQNDLITIQNDFATFHAALTQVLRQQTNTADRVIVQQLFQASTQWITHQYRFLTDLQGYSVAEQSDALTVQQANGTFWQQGQTMIHLLNQLQASEQQRVNALNAATAQQATHLLWVLFGITLCAFLGTLGVGLLVTRHVGRMQDAQIKSNQQLADVVDEVTLQRQEIEAQHASLQTTLAELEIATADAIQQRDVLEVTEQLLGKTLERSEQIQEVLLTVLETVRDGLVVYDAAGQQVYRNDVSRHILGLPHGVEHASDVAHHITILTLEGDVMPPAAYPEMRVLQGEAPDPPTNYRLLRADGSQRIIQLDAQPLPKSIDGQPGVLGVMRDITNEYRDAQQGEILRTIAHACASAADEVSIAESAVQVLMDGLHIANCSISVLDRERVGYARMLSSHFDLSIQPTQAEQLRQNFNQTLVSPDAAILSLQVLATGEARFNVQTLPFQFGEEADEQIHPMGGFTYVPIRIGAQTVGVLLAGHGDPQEGVWEAPDQDLLQAVADELGLVFHRAQLYEDAHRLAYTDPLTGLKNHRALQQVLQQELIAATAQNTPLSVIMLDVDHFRLFNEKYGHDVGDRALRVVAHAIEGAVRKQDCAARYGGEEFTVILPGASREQALEIAECIRHSIAEGRVPVREVEGGVAITASLGCASFPLNASAPTSLLKAADIALYTSKHHGRNQVTGYDPALLHAPGIDEKVADSTALVLPVHADIEAVQALITAIDLRDGYTAAHSAGVARLAALIATQMGLTATEIEQVELGGLVHDVGKIAVPDAILSKPSPLTAEEWVIMRAHAMQGEAILRNVEALRPLLPLVRWHHERMDGSGYPDGLHGDAIPLTVRILSVADILDACTSERPYHGGCSEAEGLRVLWAEVALGRLDPSVVQALEDALHTESTKALFQANKTLAA